MWNYIEHEATMNEVYVDVAETFTSIQGECSHAGYVCFFIRLAGCNLRCSYCDTPESLGTGVRTPVKQLVDEWLNSRSAIVEITGGEPLLQKGFPQLALALRNASTRPVLVETNGTLDISIVPERVITIMDIKCPSSGESAHINLNNINLLRKYDEVKFVIKNHADYLWAKEIVNQYNLISRCNSVFFSAVYNELEISELAQWIVRDKLSVCLNIQLHKLIGMK